MRLTACCLLTLFSLSALAANELSELSGDSEKAVYCFYANTVRMQMQGALQTDAPKASEMMRAAERWQSVMSTTTTDPATQRNAMQDTVDQGDVIAL